MITRKRDGLKFGLVGVALLALAACSGEALTGPGGGEDAGLNRAEVPDQLHPDLPPPAEGEQGPTDPVKPFIEPIP